MGNNRKYSLNYKQMLEDRMPVTFDNVDVEDGEEVERMWLADIIDGKYVEDYVVVRRTAYDIETDEAGAVLAMSEFKVASGIVKSCVLRKKIKNLSEIFGGLADNCYFCNQITN